MTRTLPGFTVSALPLTSLIKVAKTAGLDTLSSAQMDDLVAALAGKIEHDFGLMPCIHPDRRYQLHELKQYGYGRGRFYKAYKHLIRKDGRKSYVLGRDLLELVETAPTLAASPSPTQPDVPALPRRRGRPQKTVTGERKAADPGDAAAHQ
jgi:hypothetical protein